MANYKKGPIEQFKFGKIIIDGKEHSETKDGIQGKGKDLRIIGKDVSEWKERQGHKLKTRMVTGIYDQDVNILVIGAGAENALKVPKKVLKNIRKHGIRLVIVKRSQKACKIYNRLYRKNEKVAMLIHCTC